MGIEVGDGLGLCAGLQESQAGGVLVLDDTAGTGQTKAVVAVRRGGFRTVVIHPERGGAAVVQPEDGGGHCFHVAVIRKPDMALDRVRFGELPAAGEPHQVDHVYADPRDGAAVGRALLEPLGALAHFVRFLRRDLRHFPDLARGHQPLHRRIWWIEAQRQKRREGRRRTFDCLADAREFFHVDGERLLRHERQLAFGARQNRSGPLAVVIADGDHVELLRIEHAPVIRVSVLIGEPLQPRGVRVGDSGELDVREPLQMAQDLAGMAVQSDHAKPQFARQADGLRLSGRSQSRLAGGAGQYGAAGKRFHGRNSGIESVRMLRIIVLLMALCFAATAAGPVYVVLWFDTEDYIEPSADDAALRIARDLTSLGVRGVFKTVGEKARVLEQRKRQDVIRALAQHDIGYHTDFHSVPPTPSVYLRESGWTDGAEEFFRRESKGASDVKRIFGKQLNCYGQPGSSWGPQTNPALRRMGIHVYLDEGSQVGVESQPFWYGGLLHIFNMGKFLIRPSLEKGDSLQDTLKQFDGLAAELTARGGGMISTYYHPTEFVTTEFWDGVNFSHGAGPERKDWKLPRRRTPEDSERCYRILTAYVQHALKNPNVKFVTAKELLELYGVRSRITPIAL